VELRDLLHDIWELDPVTVEPTDEGTLRDFYNVYAPRMYREFSRNNNGASMFQWLRHLQDTRQRPHFRNASFACTLEIYPEADLPRLQNKLRTETAIACIAIVFNIGAERLCHVVNVWCNEQGFCLRDSARCDPNLLSDGVAPSLIEAVQLCSRIHEQNGHILEGMAVTSTA
jgi:hypothetical protein